MLIALLFATRAAACWTCTGSAEDCSQRIEQSRQSSAQEIRRQYDGFCAFKPEGNAGGFGISVAGSFSIRCDGQGGGCLTWVSDETGAARGENFTLSSGSCGIAKPAALPDSIPPVAAASAGLDAEGHEVSYLGP
jgi:hypothetical protein